jgi:hypothetical protein
MTSILKDLIARTKESQAEVRVYFSFDHDRDLARVRPLSRMSGIVAATAAGFTNNALWNDARQAGADDVKSLIDEALWATSVTVVCIGSRAGHCRYIDYEIARSVARGNGLVGIQINELTDAKGKVDPVGRTPATLLISGAPVYRYVDQPTLKARIDEAALSAERVRWARTRMATHR